MWGARSRLRLVGSGGQGEGQEMKLDGQAGPPEGEEGPAALPGSTDFILKGVTEGFYTGQNCILIKLSVNWGKILQITCGMN